MSDLNPRLKVVAEVTVVTLAQPRFLFRIELVFVLEGPLDRDRRPIGSFEICEAIRIFFQFRVRACTPVEECPPGWLVLPPMNSQPLPQNPVPPPALRIHSGKIGDLVEHCQG